MAQSKTHFEHINIYLVLGFFFLCYGLYSLNGYGNHNDIYSMLDTWRILVKEHHYVPSRYQGYLVPEIIIGLSAQLGGFHLSNLVSATLSISSLLIFYLLLSKITTPLTSILAVIAIGSNPFWLIASTTSTDYIYPAFFFFIGLFTLLNGRIRLAGLVFALAVSSRITYGPMVVLAFIFYFPYLKDKALRQLFFQGFILFFIASAALYLPVFIVSGMNFSFLTYADTSGGIIGIVVRFIYKNIYFWGLPTFILLVTFLLQEKNYYFQRIFTNPFNKRSVEQLIFQAVFWCFIYNEIVFAKLPHQYQYLIPVLFCLIYFISTSTTSKKVTYLSLIFALNIFYSIVCNFDVIETYQTQGIGSSIHSDAAKVAFSVKPGVLVRDFEWRSIYQKHLVKDFNTRWQTYSMFQKLEDPHFPP